MYFGGKGGGDWGPGVRGDWGSGVGTWRAPSRLRVWVLGFRVHDLGLRVQVSGLRDICWAPEKYSGLSV